MRTLVLDAGAGPRAWGRAHGETYRGEIQSLAELRIYLSCHVGAFSDADAVLAVARAHLPVLERFDRDLHDELVGIAEGARISPAHVVVLNHYTDLRDIDPATVDPATVDPATGTAGGGGGGEQADTGGCSTIWARTPSGPILAQTWDMHATAIPYVMMLKVPAARGQPAAWLFSLTGCLGMTGLSRSGVAVAINNLRSTDARIGVVWPALVRRALREPTARAARDLVMASPIGSGHHYLIADVGDAYGIETSGRLRAVVFADEADTRADARDPAGGAEPVSSRPAFVHTNHCLDPGVAACSSVSAASTTHDRYDWLAASVARAPVRDVHDAWERLGSHDGYPRSVCTNTATPANPHGPATCGAIALDLAAGAVWAQAGFIHNVEPERFDW